MAPRLLGASLPDKLVAVKRERAPPDSSSSFRVASPRDRTTHRAGPEDGPREVSDLRFLALIVALVSFLGGPGGLRGEPSGPASARAAERDAGAAPSPKTERAFPASPLSRKLDRLVAKGPLSGASVGVLVVRARDGATVYARGADRALIPASNQKLLTGLAALSRFGPTHRFTTRVWATAPIDADGAVPALVVEGGGDPAMNSEDWWLLASQLRREGLRTVRGDVRIDDTLFEPPGWHPSWGRISARAYHAPVGALTANYGSFWVAVRPRAQVGLPAHVELDPPVDYLTVRNRATTEERRARPRLSVGRGPATNDDGAPREVVLVDGGTRVGDDVDRFPRSVRDPGLYAGAMLVHQLRANGVEVDGEVVRRPLSPEAPAPILLHAFRSERTIADVVRLCMKYSNNSIAESLVKSLAAWEGANLDGAPAQQGDWTRGAAALRRTLEGLGLDLGRARLVDGSGLSLQNRLTPRLLVEALRVGRASFAFGPEFVASLPIAERDGTLEERLRAGGGRVRAKTGLLGDARVTSLSGYADRGDGEHLVFSIIVNGYTGGSGRAMDAVDALAAALLETPIASASADHVGAR